MHVRMYVDYITVALFMLVIIRNDLLKGHIQSQHEQKGIKPGVKIRNVQGLCDNL